MTVTICRHSFKYIPQTTHVATSLSESIVFDIAHTKYIHFDTYYNSKGMSVINGFFVNDDIIQNVCNYYAQLDHESIQQLFTIKSTLFNTKTIPNFHHDIEQHVKRIVQRNVPFRDDVVDILVTIVCMMYNNFRIDECAHFYDQYRDKLHFDKNECYININTSLNNTNNILNLNHPTISSTHIDNIYCEKCNYRKQMVSLPLLKLTPLKIDDINDSHLRPYFINRRKLIVCSCHNIYIEHINPLNGKEYEQVVATFDVDRNRLDMLTQVDECKNMTIRNIEYNVQQVNNYVEFNDGDENVDFSDSDDESDRRKEIDEHDFAEPLL